MKNKVKEITSCDLEALLKELQHVGSTGNFVYVDNFDKQTKGITKAVWRKLKKWRKEKDLNLDDIISNLQKEAEKVNKTESTITTIQSLADLAAYSIYALYHIIEGEI